MLNGIWIVILAVAVIVGGFSGKLEEVTLASVKSAEGAVTLAIGLVGMMALWIGLMRVLQDAGFLRTIARVLRPIMTRLFPGVPADHPAMSMMILNMTANMLGLANAATPFGLKAMIELDKLNQEKGTATNAMALFLAINTSNVALLPTGVMGLRAGLESDAPGSIILTTLLATSTSTVVAIVLATLLSRIPIFARTAPRTGVTEADSKVSEIEAIDTSEAEQLITHEVRAPLSWPRVTFWALLSAGVLVAVGWAFFEKVDAVGWSDAAKLLVGKWLLGLLLITIVLFGFFKGVKVYDSVVAGGKEGFNVALRIIPYLVAILVAVGMLRASGAIDALVAAVGPATKAIGIPAEVLPMALLRPLSGSGAYGVAAEIMQPTAPTR